MVEPGLTLRADGDDDGVRWLVAALAPGGAPPRVVDPSTPTAPDEVELSRHAVVPPRGRGRFLVPVADRRAASGSIAAYNRLRPWRTRAVRAALAAAIRAGASGPLLGRQVVVTTAPDPDGAGDDPADRWLPEHLRRVLDQPVLVVAAGLRAGDTFAKPVLQLFGADGRPVGYAKVGWNDVTVPRVRTEAEVLAAWPPGRTPGLSVPRLVHAGAWHDRFVAVTAPMPPAASRLGRRDPSPALASLAVADTGPVTSGPLRASAHWAGLRADAARLASSGARSAGPLARVVAAVEAEHLDVALRFGRWHGDWVTWNLARAGSDLWAWDWEYSDPSVPVGLDVVHHVFQEALVGRGRPAAEAVAAAATGAGRLLPAAGFDPEAVAAVVALHRAEVLRRDAAAEAAGAPPDRRLEPAHLAGVAS